jgi:hypothetical protein
MTPPRIDRPDRAYIVSVMANKECDAAKEARAQ